ncbi:MAG: hypothetical protein LBE86_10660 [Gemmobacter sp.]|nr:hypothetical protein [Gemmobacter sp.]
MGRGSWVTLVEKAEEALPLQARKTVQADPPTTACLAETALPAYGLTNILAHRVPMPRLLPVLACCLTLAGCLDMPELAKPPAPPAGPPPQILPLDALLTKAADDPAPAFPPVATRAEALRARAAALRAAPMTPHP